MKFYFSPGACSLAVHIALCEGNVKFEPIKVDLTTHTLANDGGDFYKISPRGYVPVLQLDDNSYHTEAAALLQYVGDLAPDHKLIPAAGTIERLNVIEWLAFISSELHKMLGWLWKSDLAESTVQIIKTKIAARFKELNQHFSNNDYLTSNGFTVADAYCFTILNWTKPLKIDLTPYPHIGAFMARVASRPKVQETLRAEGLIK